MSLVNSINSNSNSLISNEVETETKPCCLKGLIPSFCCCSPGEAWTNLKDCFCTPTDLGQKIRDMAANANLTDEYNDEVADTIVKAFESTEYSQLRVFIPKIFNHLAFAQINDVLKKNICLKCRK